MTNLIEKQNKFAPAFLRHVVGVMVTVKEQIPVYDEHGFLKRCIPGNNNIQKFKVLGYGQTLEAAHARAKLV